MDAREDGWVVLLLDEIDGVSPKLPWQRRDVDQVMSALSLLHRVLTPPPRGVEPASELFGSPGFQRWRGATGGELDQLDQWTRDNLELLIRLESQALEACAGDTLLHLDLRADTVLLNRQHAWIVDWPHARSGAGWVDVVGFAPSLEMQGGPNCGDLLSMLPVDQQGDPNAVNAVLASLAGMFSVGGLQPASPGLPTVRAFQFAQGVPARRWLAERLR
jgi:hypothetical protein